MASKDKEKEFFTNSGIPLKRVYTKEDVANLNEKKDLGLPGEAPFTRGIQPEMYRSKLWTIRQFSGFGTAEETNERFKLEQALGQTGLSIAFDLITVNASDADDPRFADELGIGGVHVDSLKDMEVLLDGLPIEKMNTGVIAGPYNGFPLTAMFFALAEQRGLDLKQLGGTTHNDLYLVRSCAECLDAIPPKYMLKLAGDIIEWCAKNVPRWNSVSFASYNYRENGINAYQELAFLFANVIAYSEELLSRGLKFDDFAQRFSFHLAGHSDFFEEIAKYRAARRMWHKLATERYHSQNPRAQILRFHVQTSGSTHTYQQPLNNLIRIAYQVLAAALGGAQSIHANSYDEPICLPTEQSIMLSIRTQQVAQYESNVTSVADPLGGSYYLEWLTNELERKAWEYLKQIEDMGGLIAALDSGWVWRESTKAMIEHERDVAKGKAKVVGVNCFEMEEEPHDVPLFRPNPKAVDISKARLKELKQTRDETKVKEALAEVERASRAGENVMPAVIKAVKVYATVKEVVDVWRKVYGIWKQPILV